MGHYVVYLSQSLDPRVIQRKASEVAAMMDLTTAQVHHLLEQAPGKVTHPTSLERAEYIEHIFEHVGIYAEVREVKESFAEIDESYHKEATIASEMIEQSLLVLDEGHKKFDEVADVEIETMASGDFAESDSLHSAPSPALEGYIDADAVYSPRAAFVPSIWVQRSRLLSLLLLCLLLLMGLLWWRNHQQVQELSQYNARQQMNTLVQTTKQVLRDDVTMSHHELAALLAQQAGGNQSLLALFNGTSNASRYWNHAKLSNINSRLSESAISDAIDKLSDAVPVAYDTVGLDEGDALLVTERFAVEGVGNYYLSGVFVVPEHQGQQKNFNTIMMLVFISLVISLLFSLLLTRALRQQQSLSTS